MQAPRQIETSHRLDDRQARSSWRRRRQARVAPRERPLVPLATVPNNEQQQQQQARLVGRGCAYSCSVHLRPEDDKSSIERAAEPRAQQKVKPRPTSGKTMAPTNLLIKSILIAAAVIGLLISRGDCLQQHSSSAGASQGPLDARDSIGRLQSGQTQTKEAEYTNLSNNSTPALAARRPGAIGAHQAKETRTISGDESATIGGRREPSRPDDAPIRDNEQAPSALVPSERPAAHQVSSRQQQLLTFQLPLELQLKLKPLALPQPPPSSIPRQQPGGANAFKRRRSLEVSAPSDELGADPNQVPTMPTNHLLSADDAAPATTAPPTTTTTTSSTRTSKPDDQLEHLARRSSWQEAARRVLLINSIEPHLIQAARLERRMLSVRATPPAEMLALGANQNSWPPPPPTTTTERPTNSRPDNPTAAGRTTTEVRRQRHSAQQQQQQQQQPTSAITTTPLELARARDPVEESRIQALAAAMLPFVWPSFQLTSSIQGNKLRVRSLDSQQPRQSAPTVRPLALAGNTTASWPSNIEYRHLSRGERRQSAQMVPTSGPAAASEQTPTFASMDTPSLAQPAQNQLTISTTTTTSTTTARPTTSARPTEQRQTKKKRRKSSYLRQQPVAPQRLIAQSSRQLAAARNLAANRSASAAHEDSTRLASKYQMPKIKFQLATSNETTAERQQQQLNATSSQLPSSLIKLIQQQLQANKSLSFPFANLSHNLFIDSNELRQQLMKGAKLTPTTSVSKVVRAQQPIGTNDTAKLKKLSSSSSRSFPLDIERNQQPTTTTRAPKVHLSTSTELTTTVAANLSSEPSLSSTETSALRHSGRAPTTTTSTEATSTSSMSGARQQQQAQSAPPATTTTTQSPHPTTTTSAPLVEIHRQVASSKVIRNDTAAEFLVTSDPLVALQLAGNSTKQEPQRAPPSTTTTTTTTEKPTPKRSAKLGAESRRQKQQQQKQTLLLAKNSNIKLFHFKRKPDMAKLPFYKKPLNYTELGWTSEQIQEHLLEVAKFEQQQRDASASPSVEPDDTTGEHDEQGGKEHKFIETTSRVEQTDNELLLLKRKRRAKSQFDRLMAELQAAAVASAAVVAQQQQQQSSLAASESSERSVIPVMRKKHEPLIMKPMFFVMNQKRRQQNASSPATTRATPTATRDSVDTMVTTVDPLVSSGSLANVSVAHEAPAADTAANSAPAPQVRIRRKHHGEQPLQLFSAISSLNQNDQWRPARPLVWTPPTPTLSSAAEPSTSSAAKRHHLTLIPSGLLTPSGSHLVPLYHQHKSQITSSQQPNEPATSRTSASGNWFSHGQSAAASNKRLPALLLALPEQTDYSASAPNSPPSADLQSATTNRDAGQIVAQSSDNAQQSASQMAPPPPSTGELRVPKLLVKPMRPAKYSLNGYIPKPSLNQSPNNGQAPFSPNNQPTSSLQQQSGRSSMLPKSVGNNKQAAAGRTPLAWAAQTQPQQQPTSPLLFGKDLDSSTSNEIFSRRRGLQQHQRSVQPRAQLAFNSLLMQSDASASLPIEKRQSAAPTTRLAVGAQLGNRTLSPASDNNNQLLVSEGAAAALSDAPAPVDDDDQEAKQLKMRQQLEENKRKYIQQHQQQQSFIKSPTSLSLQKVNQIRAKLGLPMVTSTGAGSGSRQQSANLANDNPHSAGRSAQQASTNRISTLDPPQLPATNSLDGDVDEASSDNNNDLTNSLADRSPARKPIGAPLNSIPKTDFECTDQKGRFVSGLFADYKTGCQVWHLCSNNRKYSFLCPAGTIFNAKVRICDWRYNVKCENTLPT